MGLRDLKKELIAAAKKELDLARALTARQEAALLGKQEEMSAGMEELRTLQEAFDNAKQDQERVGAVLENIRNSLSDLPDEEGASAPEAVVVKTRAAKSA